MRKHGTTILLVVVFLAGLSLLLYPTFSDWWNSFHQSRAVVSYMETVAGIDNDKYDTMWAEAEAYNAELAESGMKWTMTDEEQEEYNSILDVTDTGIMAYVEITKIGILLPIYHGTDEDILQTAIGHLAGTSFPVGGESTHCVISGHRGLPSAKLFTDLDRLSEGDEFVIRTLDEVLTYKIDKILIVEPTDLSALTIEEGKDYCTLVTCTPYGINTHRLLVRGHRTDNAKSAVRVSADALQVNTTLVALVLAVPMLIVLLILMLIVTGVKRRHRRR